MQNIIKWLLSLFSKKHKGSSTSVDTDCQAKFPSAKGYIIYTREGGRLNCASQRDVADTIATLYDLPIKRDHVHHALGRYRGRLAYKGEYIATIKYRKENQK